MDTLVRTLMFALLVSVAASLAAAPVGYSINSDSLTEDADSLYRIDLGAATESRIAPVKALGQTRLDVEGLAFAPDGTLYGVDDDTRRLFPLNPQTAVVDTAHEVSLDWLPIGGKNDFGLTFACDGSLYMTSIAKGSLYRRDRAGNWSVVGGAEGELLPAKINAIAAWGSPVELYGLGNGATETGEADTPFLYRIDPASGTATKIGPLDDDDGITDVGPYLQGGLDFDDAGQLWAVTEGAQFGWASQVMKVDKTTGAASDVKTLAEKGFESLAITVPRGCQGGGDRVATFTVQKQFLDGNDKTPVTLNIHCNTGLPLEQSTTVVPNAGPFGKFETAFTVSSFQDGALDCEVWESQPLSYTPAYDCLTTGACAPTASACTFTGVTADDDNLCMIRNSPNPVQIAVSKEWVDSGEGLAVDHVAGIELFCEGMLDGDGYWVDSSQMRWDWDFGEGSGPQIATVYPRFDGSTYCKTVEKVRSSAVESIATCGDWTQIALGAGVISCSVINTVFFEGIPALNPVGLAVAALLLLLTGLVAVRRF